MNVPGNSAAPQQVGPYRLDERLGQGGMGEVYRGYDARLERAVALKRVLTERDGDDTARVRFRLEARAVAKLSHAAVVQVHDWIETDDGDWIVMELVAGTSLRETLEHGALEPRRAARIVRDVASGLAAAHRAGIIHRDLKPENLMLTPADEVKILDFGLAKVTHKETNVPMVSVQGQVMGTLPYISPEQARGRPLDHRSDLFSLGTIFYEMLTGTRPFQGDGVDILTNICTRQPRKVRDVNPTVPQDVEAVVMLLLEKDPTFRPQTAAEVVHRIEGLLHPMAPVPSAEESVNPTETIVDRDVPTINLNTPALRVWPREPPLPERPYPVLLPYEHPALLAGRDRDLERLRRQLRMPQPILCLAAPSGTGKSSLLLGALVPTWRREGRPVAIVRHPAEPNVGGRLLTQLLNGDVNAEAFVEHLETVERLAGEPPLLILDQFEDVFRESHASANARKALGELLCASVERRPNNKPRCRWLLGYREEFHGEVYQWLGSLPRDLTGPERFHDFSLCPLGTASPGKDPRDEARRVFLDAIERPLDLTSDNGERVFPWQFANGDAERLALAFADARCERPEAPLTPELQVVLAHLLKNAGEPDNTAPDNTVPVTVHVPDDAERLVGEALEDHLRRALENAFPGAKARTERARALLALRELASEDVRRDGLPADVLARAMDPDALEMLARSDTRLVVPRNAEDGRRYVLSHDRMAEAVVRMVDEEAADASVDDELLRLRQIVDLKVALWRSHGDQGTRLTRRQFGLVKKHREALLWDDGRRSWWRDCVRRRRARRHTPFTWTLVVVFVLALSGYVMWSHQRQAGERQTLLEQVAGGEPDVALRVLLGFLPDDNEEEIFSHLWQRPDPLDVLDRMQGEEAGNKILRIVENAIPRTHDTPNDMTLRGRLVWALDIVAARDPLLVADTRRLRDRVLGPLYRSRPRPEVSPDDWVDVPAGTFMMGSPEGEGDDDEHPQHEVTLSAFRMLRHEVTNGEYRRLVPGHAKGAPDDLPAAKVSWYAAYIYSDWLGGRLPTEAEWEYAARADCVHAYCLSDGSAGKVTDVAWISINSERSSQPVMQLAPNPLGLYDMLGNVWEYTGDGYASYQEDTDRDPRVTFGGRRVIRGGSFWNSADWTREANREEHTPIRVDTRGFRVVLPVAPSP